METTLDCNTTLTQFASRQFANWQGLAPDCVRADVDVLFPRDDDWIGSGRLGERDYDYIWLPVAGYEEPVRAWLDGEQLILLEVKSPELADLAHLISQLGEPDARLDAHRHTLSLKEVEWVYPQRGLTLFVYPTDGDVYHLAVYPPCTLERYLRDFRPNLKVTRSPLRRD